MDNVKMSDQSCENFDNAQRATVEIRNDEVRFWQSVSLRLAIFVLSLFASLVIALVLMLVTR